MMLNLWFSIEFMQVFALAMTVFMGLGMIWADGREA